MEKFPGTLAGVGLLGAAINGKLTEIRLKHRKMAVGGDADTDGKIDLTMSRLTREAAHFFCKRLAVFSLLRILLEQIIFV